MTTFHSFNTPESAAARLGRNDSKNATTTCKGITTSGRPCRRALKATPNSSPSARRSSGTGLSGIAIVVEDGGSIPEADLYCWQHKDQAEARANAVNNEPRKATARRGRSAELFPLQEKSSIDTLVQKLGIQDQGAKHERKTRQPRPPKRTSTVDFARPANAWKQDLEAQGRHSAKAKKPGFWSSLCCTGNTDDDYVEVVRHRRRTEQTSRPQENLATEKPSRRPHESRPSSSWVHGVQPAPGPLPRPAQQRKTSNPQTDRLLSLVPQHCSPQTTSSLLAELIKPISAADEEGYIYIFWLTPQSKEAPAESTARSLLGPRSERPAHARRISDVMTEFSYEGSEERSRSTVDMRKREKTIMLKIGRASNVTRRMNEWQRQCGYKLNLVRWYPCVQHSSPSEDSRCSDPSQTPHDGTIRKVPFAKRVERLIHLELSEKRVLRDCETCGKEHREWFEVDANQEGIREIDACIKRWIDWAEGQARA